MHTVNLADLALNYADSRVSRQLLLGRTQEIPGSVRCQFRRKTLSETLGILRGLDAGKGGVFQNHASSVLARQAARA